MSCLHTSVVFSRGTSGCGSHSNSGSCEVRNTRLSDRAVGVSVVCCNKARRVSRGVSS